MNDNYAACYAYIRREEGGNSDFLKDPGGRTSRGVTQRVYDAYRRRKMQPPADVWKASEEEISDIYRSQYWDAVRGDALPAGIDLVVFDGAVNSGPKQSIKWLQAALNAKRTSGATPTLTVDGVMGAMTLDAASANTNHDAVVAEICARRLGFLKRLSTWRTFGKGWSARVSRMMAAGQRMASGEAAPEVVVSTPAAPAEPVAAPKASVEDLPAPPVSSGMAMSGTVASGSLAGIADAVQKTQDITAPIQDLSTVLHWVFVGAAVIGVLLVLYAAYREGRAKRATNADVRADVPA